MSLPVLLIIRVLIRLAKHVANSCTLEVRFLSKVLFEEFVLQGLFNSNSVCWLLNQQRPYQIHTRVTHQSKSTQSEIRLLFFYLLECLFFLAALKGKSFSDH